MDVWSLEDLAAALRVALDGLETFERAGADLLLTSLGAECP